MNLKALILAAALVTVPGPAAAEDITPLNDYLLKADVNDPAVHEFLYLRCSGLYMAVLTVLETKETSETDGFNAGFERFGWAAFQLRKAWSEHETVADIFENIDDIAAMYLEPAKANYSRTGTYFSASPFPQDLDLCLKLETTLAQ